MKLISTIALAVVAFAAMILLHAGIQSGGAASGGSGLPIIVDGTPLGTATSLELDHGTNVTLSSSITGGAAAITINATGGGGGGALTLISSQTLGTAAASVTFSSIPGTYTDLILSITARGDVSSTTINPGLQFNGDTGNNYFYSVQGTDGTTGAGGPIAYAYMGNLSGGSATAGLAGNAVITIPYYANTSFSKIAASQSNAATALAGTNIQAQQSSAYWSNTAAIKPLMVGRSQPDGSTLPAEAKLSCT